MAQKSVLGKGLASLLPSAANLKPPAPPTPPSSDQEKTGVDPAAGTGTGAVAAGPPQIPKVPPGLKSPQQSLEKEIEDNKERIPGISMAMVGEIKVNPYQPRRSFDEAALKELSDSIRTSGVLQPLVVRKTSEGYQLIAGERRLRAAKLSGLKQVPIVIRRSTDREALELALVENIQRHDLNCVDEALAYHQLNQDFSLTQEQIAQRVGKDRATVSNLMRLLKLPEEVLLDLKKDRITLGHGKALLGIDDRLVQLKIHRKILEKKLSVRETESLINEIKTRPSEEREKTVDSLTKKGKEDPVQQRFDVLKDDLMRQVGLKVEIKGNDARGRIVLHYRNRSDLDRIITKLQNER